MPRDRGRKHRPRPALDLFCSSAVPRIPPTKSIRWSRARVLDAEDRPQQVVLQDGGVERAHRIVLGHGAGLRQELGQRPPRTCRRCRAVPARPARRESHRTLSRTRARNVSSLIPARSAPRGCRHDLHLVVREKDGEEGLCFVPTSAWIPLRRRRRRAWPRRFDGVRPPRIAPALREGRRRAIRPRTGRASQSCGRYRRRR